MNVSIERSEYPAISCSEYKHRYSCKYSAAVLFILGFSSCNFILDSLTVQSSILSRLNVVLGTATDFELGACFFFGKTPWVLFSRH